MPSQKFASSGNSSFISDEKELQVVSVNWHFEQVVKLGSMPNNKNYVDNSEYEEIPTLWSAIQCEINYISVHSSPVSRTPELKRTQVLVLFVRLMSAPEQTRYLQPSLMSLAGVRRTLTGMMMAPGLFLSWSKARIIVATSYSWLGLVICPDWDDLELTYSRHSSPGVFHVRVWQWVFVSVKARRGITL